MEKSDDHYRNIESDSIEPIIIMEELLSRMIENEIPYRSVLNIVLAQKHITRCGSKKGEDWKKEIQKSINYLTRSITGEWIK